jgi:hypothetical protein
MRYETLLSKLFTPYSGVFRLSILTDYRRAAADGGFSKAQRRKKTICQPFPIVK